MQHTNRKSGVVSHLTVDQIAKGALERVARAEERRREQAAIDAAGCAVEPIFSPPSLVAFAVSVANNQLQDQESLGRWVPPRGMSLNIRTPQPHC